ncbi:MAG: MFS transporter, partial [Gammaproteobacteria bacterium]
MSSSQFLRSLILPVYLPAIFFVLVNTACIIVLPLYLLDQGAGIAVASMAATLRGVGVLLVDVPAGIIANRLGDKPVMLLGVGTALLATALLVLFDSVWIVLLAAMLIGGSGGLYLMGRMSYINDVCQPHQRARALAVIATMQRFGSLVSPLVFSLVARSFSYDLVFQLMALLILCNLVLVILFARDIDVPHRRAARIRDMFTMAWQLRRIFMTAGMAGMMLMALRAGRQILFPVAGY